MNYVFFALFFRSERDSAFESARVRSAADSNRLHFFARNFAISIRKRFYKRAVLIVIQRSLIVRDFVLHTRFLYCAKHVRTRICGREADIAGNVNAVTVA